MLTVNGRQLVPEIRVNVIIIKKNFFEIKKTFYVLLSAMILKVYKLFKLSISKVTALNNFLILR